MRVTGIGSLPSTSMPRALAFTFDAVPDYPYLPELPARGPHAALIGRTGALLTGIPVDRLPSGWRVAEGRSAEQAAARDLLSRDLADLQVAAFGYAGPLKVACAGPWTMAASLERSRGGLVLADPAARRDIAQSLADGLAAFLADVRVLVPGAQLSVQLDEPLLPAVFAGTVKTASGLDRYRPVDEEDLGELLTLVRSVADAGDDCLTWVLHSCAPGVPIACALGSVDALALDLDQLTTRDWDALAAGLDAGRELYLGVLPTSSEARPSPDALANRALRALRPLELPDLASRVVLTPACGLAGWTVPAVTAGFAALREASTIVEAELAG